MKNKKSLIIYSATVIIIAVAIVVIILYFNTDLFKSNRQLFYKYLGQTKIINMEFFNRCNIANDAIFKKSNTSNMKVKILSSKINQETQISDIKEVAAIESKGLKNVLLKQSYRDFVVLKDNKVVLNMRGIRDNNTYGVMIENMLVKYLAVENSDLKDLFLKLGVQDTTFVPDSIITNYEEVFQINNNMLEQLKEIYFDLIYKNISKENFYKFNNDDKTKIIGVSLSEEEFFNILKLLLETAKNDKVLLNDIIVRKLHLLKYNDLNEEIIKLEIQKYIDIISNNTYSSNKDYIKIFFKVKEDKVINIETEINYKKENNVGEESVSNNEYKRSFGLDIEKANNIILTIKENNKEKVNVTFNYIYDNEKINVYTEIQSFYNQEKHSLKLQYQISNYQTENIKQVVVVDLISTNEKYQAEINNNIMLKTDVQISKLTTENSSKINKLSVEELQKLKVALINRVKELYAADLKELYDITRRKININK